MSDFGSFTDNTINDDLNQFVVFNLDDKIFGVDVKKVQEVIKIDEINRIPNSMAYMKGVIDLRDTIIPIVDLRLKFNLEEKKHDKDTSVLITEIFGFLIGLVIDSVLDVVNIEISDMYHIPDLGLQLDEEVVQGVGKHNGEQIIILNVNSIFKQEEIEFIK